MNLKSPLKFDNSTLFTYELIPKNETQKYIQQFDKFSTRKKEDEPKFTFTFFGRDRTSTVHQWEIKDIEQYWKEIKEESNKFLDTTEFSRKYVNNFTLFLIKIPYFPYDVIVVKSELDSQKISQVTSHNELLNIFNSINNFMNRFQGIIYKSGTYGKYRPCYVKFEIKENDKDVDSQLQQITKLENNKKLEDKKQINQYYNLSKKFRISHFDKEWQKSDMLSLILKQNSFSIIGFLNRIPNRMTYSNFEIIFRKKQRTVNWAQNTVFRGLDYDFSTFFHFVSIQLFLHYVINNLDKLEAEFDNLISEYKEIRAKKFKEQEKLYQKISDLSENLFFIKSDLNLMNFELENPLSIAIKQLPNYNLISDDQYSSDNSFSIGMLQATFENGKNSVNRILEKLSVIQKKTDDLKDKFDKKIMFENSENSVKLAKESGKTQKSMKWQGRITIGLTVAVLVLTGAILNYTYTQFEIENFESEFLVNNPHIVLGDRFAFQQFEYLIPIEINALTSHSYRVNVSPIEDSFKLQNYGECFLGKAPEIIMIEPMVFFLDSGANENSIEPKFRLNYEAFPNSYQINQERTVNHSVGNIQFKIEAQNLQIPEDKVTLYKNVGVSIPFPSDATDKFCDR